METNDTKYEPIKICWRQPLKSFTWSILEYFLPNKGVVSLTLKENFLFVKDSESMSH